MNSWIGIDVAGALGDTILHYFRKNGAIGCLASFKNNNPTTKVRLYCCSSNTQTPELFRFNPYIDDIKYIPWEDKHHRIIARNRTGKEKKIYQSNNRLPSAKYREPKIYLSDEDKKLIKPILKNDYVLIHPFTSTKGTQPIGDSYYLPIIDDIIDSFNLNVVVVGSTHERKLRGQTITKVESFSYERDGLYNLTNTTSVRAAIELARNCKGYVGSWSAFFCASAWCPIGPISFVRQAHRHITERVNKRRFPGCKYHMVRSGKGTTKEGIRKEVFKILKKGLNEI